MQEAVYEYFNEYFNGTLNESTTNAEIMEAVYDLVYLTEAVCEEVGIGKKITNTIHNLKKGFRQGRDRAIARKRERASKRNQQNRPMKNPYIRSGKITEPRIGKMWGF